MALTHVAEDFRFTLMLLAVKTGAAASPSEDVRAEVMLRASQATIDGLLKRLLADAVALGLWERDAKPR